MCIGTFRYKQRGKEAISSNNVFFYITYEGAVDIDKIMDPVSFCYFKMVLWFVFFYLFFTLLLQQKVQQRSTQDQIAYFGQTPSQLLKVPHLKKMPLSDVLHLQVFLDISLAGTYPFLGFMLLFIFTHTLCFFVLLFYFLLKWINIIHVLDHYDNGLCNTLL